jgi:hypothetical protein
MQHREIFRRTLGAIEWGLIARTVIVVFVLAILFRLLGILTRDRMPGR